MNNRINHGSVEELIALNARGREPHTRGLVGTFGLRAVSEAMEKYDPEGKKSHEIAKRYFRGEEREEDV